MYFFLYTISTKKGSLDHCAREKKSVVFHHFLLVKQGCSGRHLTIKYLETAVQSSSGLIRRTCSVVSQLTVDYKSRVVKFGPEQRGIYLMR